MGFCLYSRQQVVPAGQRVTSVFTKSEVSIIVSKETANKAGCVNIMIGDKNNYTPDIYMIVLCRIFTCQYYYKRRD